MVVQSASAAGPRRTVKRAGTFIIVIAVMVAVWCLGFAVINVGFEITDRFAHGSYARYASAFTVMNWFVVALKVLGAAVALMSVSDRPRLLSPSIMSVLVWGAFATLGLYVLGSMVQAVGMVVGYAGDTAQLDVAGVGYVLAFLAAAAGYGVLAISYSRRHRLRKRFAVLGVLVGPVMLVLILLAVPFVLRLLGLMPA